MTDASSLIAASATPYAASTATQPQLPSTAGTGTGQDVDAVSKDFEAVFLSQMLSAMFSGDDTSSYFGGGTAGDVTKSYMMNEFGKAFAQAGGIGIASSVKQELLKLQEVAQ